MAGIKKINGKFYDFGTSNKSFLLTAQELKALGIKNYYFMLEIKDPRAAMIDVWNPKITKQEAQIVMQELSINMWFWARSVARIRSDKGVVPLELHRGLTAAFWCFLKSQDYCLCEPRQTYKTTGHMAAPLSWAFQLASENAKFHFFGKDSENTKKNIRDLRNSIEELPEWLRFDRYRGDDGKVKKTRRATESIENKVRKNAVIMHPKPSSIGHAQAMARGDSMSIVYLDEIEHTPFIDVILANMAPAFKTASDNAKQAGKPTCRVMTTTCGNLDTREGIVSKPIIESMIPWTEKLYDMTDAEIQEYKSAAMEAYNSDPKLQASGRAPINVFYIEYQYWQVRKTHRWVEEQYALSGDRMAIRREILNQRLRGSSNSPIAADDLEFMIAHMQKSNVDLLLNKKWLMKVYPHGQGQNKLFDARIPYIVGIDPSGGGGGDNTAIEVINPFNLQVAAECRSPYMGGTELLRSVIDLVNNHMPKAVIIPEKNSMGIYFIQSALETSIRPNLYWSESTRQLAEIAEESETDYELKVLSQQYRKYGTYLTKTNRDAMFQLLFNHVAECRQLLNTEYLVDDICKLVRTSTGKIEAIKGEHDDSLMAYLHAIFIYYTGDNLELFGIRRDEHPIIGTLEPDYDEHIEARSTNTGFLSSEYVSFESIMVSAMMEEEHTSRFLVDTLGSAVNHPVYSNRKIDPLFDGDTDINPMFFEMVNER